MSRLYHFPQSNNNPSEAELVEAGTFLELVNDLPDQSLLKRVAGDLLFMLAGARLGRREDLTRFWSVAHATTEGWDLYTSLVEQRPYTPGPGSLVQIKGAA